jgi:hypothetical protein
MRLRVFAITCLLGAPVFAGGAWLSFADPKSSTDPLAAGALTTVKLVSPAGKTLDTVEISGTADGLVDGERVSVPIGIEKLSTPGLRAIRWRPASQGQWVLAFNVRIAPNGPGVVAVVKARSDGVKDQLVPLNLGLSWKSTLIESAFTSAKPLDAAVLPGGWRFPQ